MAAAFVYGREAITGKMFLPLITQLKSTLPTQQQSQLSAFIYYCQPHIELDQSDHLPKAMTMLTNLMNTEQDYHAIATAAQQALQARLNFLTGIEKMIQNNKNPSPVGKGRQRVAANLCANRVLSLPSRQE